MWPVGYTRDKGDVNAKPVNHQQHFFAAEERLRAKVVAVYGGSWKARRIYPPTDAPVESPWFGLIAVGQDSG